jgi:hypothetical protein
LIFQSDQMVLIRSGSNITLTDLEELSKHDKNKIVFILSS